MIHINETSLRKDLFGVLSNTIKFNETVCVSTKDGNAIIISEEEYNGMIASLELSSCPPLKDKILSGKVENLNECINIEDVLVK